MNEQEAQRRIDSYNPKDQPLISHIDAALAEYMDVESKRITAEDMMLNELSEWVKHRRHWREEHGDVPPSAA